MHHWLKPIFSAFDVLGRMFKRQATRDRNAAGWVRCMAGLFYTALLAGSSLAHAGPSTVCPTPQTMRVASGGQATIDLYYCAEWGFGGIPVRPSHGSIPSVNAGGFNGDGIATYVNNGDGATSDTFSLDDGNAGTIVFNVTIDPPTSPITVTPAIAPNPVIGNAYSQILSAAGGVAPYSYALVSGALPTGLTLSGNTISGTPTATGGFVAGIQVTDSTVPTALTTTKNFAVTIGDRKSVV